MTPRVQTQMGWQPRLAQESDIPALETLIPLSLEGLGTPHYSRAQLQAALGPVFAVDRQLIRDRTYFVVEHEHQLIGSGGWSMRNSHYGGGSDPADQLHPPHDAARIRAFFVHPHWARRGIARCMLRASEQSLLDAGFHSAELVATLSGEPFYTSLGYSVIRRFEISIPGAPSLLVVAMAKRFAAQNETH